MTVPDAPTPTHARPTARPPGNPPATAGPLLAVCALCGGAGASTLAYLVARASARSPGEPVLVCDTGGTTAGLAAYAGVESPQSFARLADTVADREPLTDGLFADGGDGLRVIARGPQIDVDGDARGVARVLADARRAHRLTVVDCGTLSRRSEWQALAGASHVAWVLPATAGALRRGRRLLQAFPGLSDRRELLVARLDVRERRAPMQQLRELAGERQAPLVLMPHVPDPLGAGQDAALQEAGLALDAIDTVLRR